MDISEIVKSLTAQQRDEYRYEIVTLQGVFEDLRKQPDLDVSETRFRNVSYIYERLPRVRLLQATLLLARVARSGGAAPETATLCGLIQLLLRRNLGLDTAAIEELLEFVAGFETLDLKVVPIQGVVSEVEKTRLEGGVPPAWKEQLTALATRLKPTGTKVKGPTATVLARIEKLCDDSILSRIVADGGWADAMVADVRSLPAASQRKWESLLRHAASIAPQPPAKDWEVSVEEIGWNPADPTFHRRFYERKLDLRCSTSWQERMLDLICDIGADQFWSQLLRWLDLVPRSKPGHLARESVNRELLRGLYWSLWDCPSAMCDKVLGSAADIHFKKNSPLGTACVLILGHRATPGAMSQLTLLSTRAKADNQRQLIALARERMAVKYEIPVEDLEDLSIPTSGFTEPGRRRELLAGFAAEITLEGRSANLQWFKSNGQPQGSVPAVVKREHADELADLKRATKEAETTLAAVASRFESAPVGQRSWRVGEWRSRYLDHPVAGTVVRRLLWTLSDSQGSQVAGWDERGFVDWSGNPLRVGDNARIAVWHPAGSTVETVAAWRAWLEERQITQPFKQAHREIYLLTDAERATGVYSNRFASHILRQSQFRALARGRGWTSDFLGSWDGGDSGNATRVLPHWQLRAEFWVNAAGMDHTTGENISYIATDQVRFYREGGPAEPLPLTEVPPLVFSEVLRDVDLFVGISSVGNNPEWQDGGPDGRYRDYWHDFSFGALTETALTRKAVLERLIPRLAIADRCRFDGKHLVVRGDLRTYKIHLGSSSILMEPNDQYLCIVPDRGASRDRSDYYVPFEGDHVLSVIVSKALLLANDTQITDPTITRQIRAR